MLLAFKVTQQMSSTMNINCALQKRRSYIAPEEAQLSMLQGDRQAPYIINLTEQMETFTGVLLTVP